MREPLECIDTGTEYCPCYLAETNDCITCSILQGEKFCDCNWRGVCVYQEYVWNNNQSTNRRSFYKAKILNKTEINDNTYIIKLEITKTLARLLKEPGAYIFLRGENLPQYFDTPMSVMYSDDINGIIYVAYQVLGTKTKRMNIENEALTLKGPYWNGSFGLKSLKSIKNSKVLIIARGIAQAPALLVIEKLLKNKNELTCIIDEGNTGDIFIKEFIKDFKIELIIENLNSHNGETLIKRLLNKNEYKLVYIGGSDVLQLKVLNIVEEIGMNTQLALTNNSEICCGEGVCGACSTYLEDGKVVKACKTQLEAREIIKRRVYLE